MTWYSDRNLPPDFSRLDSGFRFASRRKTVAECPAYNSYRIERFGWTFCAGDKVMQVENDYDKDVYNGDLGVVSRIDMEEGELSVCFDAAKSPTGLVNSTS